MILLDHNIPRDQVQELRRARVRCEQVGYEVGRPEWEDQEEILRYLHHEKRPTFVTRDQGFFRRKYCHRNYCIVVVMGPALETTTLVRRLLRHPRFRARSKRCGCVVKLTPSRILLLQHPQRSPRSVRWDET